MEFDPSALPEVIVLRPKVHADERGYLIESFQAAEFAAAGLARSHPISWLVLAYPVHAPQKRAGNWGAGTLRSNVPAPLFPGISSVLRRQAVNKYRGSFGTRQRALGLRRAQGEIWTLEPVPGLTLYFIEQPEFYQRAGLYQKDGADYPDNAERFIFFSRRSRTWQRICRWPPKSSI